jgi:hypothetical protein
MKHVVACHAVAGQRGCRSRCRFGRCRSVVAVVRLPVSTWLPVLLPVRSLPVRGCGRTVAGQYVVAGLVAGSVVAGSWLPVVWLPVWLPVLGEVYISRVMIV